MPESFVTEDRRTWLTFDDERTYMLQPNFALERKGLHIAQEEGPRENVHYVPGVGWRLKAYQFDPGATHELSVAASGVQSVAAGLLSKAASHEEFNTQRQSGLSGVTYDGVASSGSPFVQKRVGAGASFEQRLAGDQSAFDGPFPDSDGCDLDRIARTTGDHDPDDGVHFRWYAEGAVQNATVSLAKLYFSGPSGRDPALVGVGQYCLVFRGDGEAILYERGYDEIDPETFLWARRFSFQYAPANQVYGPMHTISITSSSGCGNKGGSIMFLPSSIGQSNALIESLIGLGIASIRADSGLHPVFRTPKVGVLQATQHAPIRVDVRRDVRAMFQVNLSTYPEEGFLTDDIFSIEVPPYGPEDIKVEWYGCRPEGTDITVKLFDATTGDEIAGSVEQDESWGGMTQFPIVDGVRHYQARFTLTGDGSRTPTLKGCGYFRLPMFEGSQVTPLEWPEREALPALWPVIPQSISITGPDREPQQESATVHLTDLVDDFAFLRVQGAIPIKIETVYNEGGDRSVLFQGYVQQALGRRLPAKLGVGAGEATPSDFETPLRYAYDLECHGEYLRLAQQHPPRRFTWHDNAVEPSEGDEKKAYTITRIIRELLLASGYQESQIDVPEIPVRLFSLDDDEYVFQPGSPVADLIVGLARDYLGAFLIWDANAGAAGMWRLLQQKVAPYNVVARFHTLHPGDSILPHHPGAYPDVVDGDQTIKQTFVRGGTLRAWAEPPEGNAVTVYGAAQLGASARQGKKGAALMTQTLLNHNSYNFENLDPSDENYPDISHPDWIGRYVPIKRYDGSLSSQKAVDWVARRLFDYACHARTYFQFEAPLILVTDSTDAQQTRPRPLRFYDVVELQLADESWQKAIVASCNPMWENDRFQWAAYELVIPSNLDEKATP